MTGVIKTGLEKYVDKIPGTPSINELQKLLFGEQLTLTGSVNQVNFLVPKDHGFAPVLQRLTKQVKNYKWHNYKSKL